MVQIPPWGGDGGFRAHLLYKQHPAHTSQVPAVALYEGPEHPPVAEGPRQRSLVRQVEGQEGEEPWD